MFRLISLNTRMSTEDDMNLDYYSNNRLTSINTCPTYGVLTSSQHKEMPNTSRAMPLEAGSVAHDGFAAVRWYQYYHFQHDGNCETVWQNAMMHGERLFPNGRFGQMFDTIQDGSTHRTNVINFTCEAVETADFYDDITDKKRTVSNIQEALIAYIDAWDMVRYPIWIRDPSDPFTDIGIEIPFDIVVEIDYEDKIGIKKLTIRFKGILDGLHTDPKYGNRIFIEENKTASVLNDNWLSQWILSHQITGYCLAATTFTNEDCDHAVVSGMRIPIGRNSQEGIRKEHVNRNALMYEKWANWVVTSVSMERAWRDDPINAPMYTHSCNRYFSVCEFLPFCAATSIEEKKLILSEMVDKDT
jgi:hypothetical protein